MSEELFKNNDCPNCPIHIPKEAYYFIPDLYDEMLYDKKKEERSLRLIFDKADPNDFLKHEQKHFNSFSSYILSNYGPSFFPDNWTTTDTRKCLQSSEFDYEKTVEKIRSVSEYPEPKLEIEEVEEILKSGFVYMHGLDKNFRPIVVVKALKFVELIDKYSVNHFIAAIKYFFDYLFKHFIIKGQVENWVIIADVNGVSLWSPPTKLLDVFEYLQNKFLCRLFVLYVYGMSFILNMCYKIIKNFIDDRTTKKFNFINGDGDIKEYVLNHIHPSQLESRFGGTCPDISNQIDFPFFLPSSQFQVDDSNKNKIISEKEYISLVKRGKFKDISPYIMKRTKSIANNGLKMNKKNDRNGIKKKRNKNRYYEDEYIGDNYGDIEKNNRNYKNGNKKLSNRNSSEKSNMDYRRFSNYDSLDNNKINSDDNSDSSSSKSIKINYMKDDCNDDIEYSNERKSNHKKGVINFKGMEFFEASSEQGDYETGSIGYKKNSNLDSELLTYTSNNFINNKYNKGNYNENNEYGDIRYKKRMHNMGNNSNISIVNNIRGNTFNNKVMMPILEDYEDNMGGCCKCKCVIF